MLKKTFLFSIIISFCLIQSCKLILIKGNLKGLTSNYDKTKKECRNLINDSFNQTKSHPRNGSVNVVNGNQLSVIIKRSNKALVYIWSPTCKSKFCPSLQFIKTQCEANFITLYIVLEFYDCSFYNQILANNLCVYGVDTKYYQTEFTQKYINKFLVDITGVDNIQMGDERLYFFENGQYKRKSVTFK